MGIRVFRVKGYCSYSKSCMTLLYYSPMIPIVGYLGSCMLFSKFSIHRIGIEGPFIGFTVRV